jgi:hypothetical protein
MADICGHALTWRKDKAILLGGFPRKARGNGAREPTADLEKSNPETADTA